MKKLGILLLAAAFAIFGLMTFAACNEETLGPDDPDDPIVTPEPDDPDDPGKPEEPTPPEEEPEATEGLVFELITTENSDGFDGFEEFFGEGFEDFYVCTGLTVAEENVVIPSTYNGLPVRAVLGFDVESEIANGIISVYISDSVQMILWNTYETFENLTEIRLPRNPNVLILGSSYLSGCAFYNDPNNWDNGALYMDDWLLATNDDLPEEYTVKQGTHGIAAVAFTEVRGSGYESHVKRVTVPDGVQAVAGSFMGCISLKEVVLPDSLFSISYGAFYDCSSLTSITIPNRVTSIGDDAFHGCSSLTGVYISDLAAWCRIAFGDSYSNPLSYAGKLYLNDVLVIDLVISDGVTSIGDYAFSGCSGLTSIMIPDSVTSIGDEAFSDCGSLTSITIPDSVTSIGEGAFEDCYGLTSVYIFDLAAWCGIEFVDRDSNPLSYAGKLYLNDVLVMDLVIPDSVTSIGDYAFSGCDGLTSITIPDSVTSIGDSAFYACSGLTSITIPDSVTSIGGDAFLGCSGLTSVTIGDGVTTMGDGVFGWCSSLTSITIPDGVTAIGDGAFEWCERLTSITIPDSVTSIGERAFYVCYSLTSITIPDSATSIGERAFAGCDSLTSIIVDPQNPVYHSEGNCLIETKSKTLIIGCGASVIPADGSVTSVGEIAFSYCNGLTSIVIPDSVTSIGDYAFEYCFNLTSITISDSVTSIGEWAFSGYDSLETVYYTGSEAEWNKIEIRRGNGSLEDANIIYNYTGE